MMMPCPTTIPLEVKTSRQQETVQADTVGTLVIGCADYWAWDDTNKQSGSKTNKTYTNVTRIGFNDSFIFYLKGKNSYGEGSSVTCFCKSAFLWFKSKGGVLEIAITFAI